MEEDLTPEARAEWRDAADAALARSRERAATLARDLDHVIEASADAVRDDEHDPEGQTVAWERAQIAGLLAEAEARTAALIEARERTEREGGDRCAGCGRSIPLERLLVRPETTTCVSCAA